MKTTTKKFKRTLSIIVILVLIVSNFTGFEIANTNVRANAATNGIVKGPDTVDEEDSFSTTLSDGQSVTIKIVNSILTIKVEASEYIFQMGNIKKTTDAAVINEKDGLLHILTLSGAYYVFDLYTGVQIVAYRNSSNGKYCSSKNSYAYMVYGKSLINNTYFYELLTSNSVSRELLMTREEFDIIVNGGDPSVDPTPAPTQIPTVEPTIVPTQQPTVEPTIVPTKLPTIEFNFEFWWESYINGTITWEQFTEIMWKYQWTATSQSTEKSTTYYFYDSDGKLIRTETVTISTSTENGSGSGNATLDNEGKAEIEIETEGEGGGSGNIIINTPIPTIEPTTVPTQEPTIVPTQQPTIAPTQVPTIEFNFEFWWESYINGTITWEQFTEIMSEYQWTATSQSTEKSTTYYFYDSNGKLIRTETETTGSTTENGSGSGNATVDNQGKAEIEIETEGEGGGSGTVIVNTPVPIIEPTIIPVMEGTLSVSKKVIVIKAGKSKTITYSAKDSNGNIVKAEIENVSNVATAKVTSDSKIKITASSKASNCTYTTINVKNGNQKLQITVIISKTVKKHARVVTSGSRIKLFTSKNKLHGWLIFDKKKGELNWNGYKLKNVKTCGFIKGSWNVIVVMKNGKVYKLQKNVNKGETAHKTRIKCEKAIGLNRDTYGFVTKVKLQCGGIKNVSGK